MLRGVGAAGMARILRGVGWRWLAAATLFSLAVFGFSSGVTLSERPSVVDAGLLTRAYYALGLFVVGGLDLGTPQGGPVIARALLWTAYFAAPLLTASAVIEALVRVMAPDTWFLRRLKQHVIVAGTDDLTTVFLRVLRRRNADVPVVVVGDGLDRSRDQQLGQTFGVRVIAGDITHEHFLRELRPGRAQRVVLLSGDSLQSFEAADVLLRLYPQLASRIVMHCPRLRFLRAMASTDVAQSCATFNAYHLAAAGLVRDQLIGHFHKTRARDAVVIAGFGRFGQSVLEELQRLARDEIDTVALIDIDAHRRVQVVEEQERIEAVAKREILEGDISHPEVWRRLEERIDLASHEPTVILGTGHPEENLRVALWIKQRHPNAFVFARTDDVSDFARHVAADHGIHSISITELVERNIPDEWLP